ncbi:MAG: pentapeptide repeat-containing protein [Paracoccaceae bacterium]
MASDARKSLRKAYEDTAGLIGRLVPSFFITCLSTIIFAGSDDRVLLGGGEIAHPLVGKTRYEIFMIIAPVAILVLRLYIDMQVAHLNRIEDILARVRKRYSIRLLRPVTVNAKSNRVMMVAGVLAIHVMPPFAIAFLGRHASAAYPEYGLVLYVLAFVLTAWSGVSLYHRLEGRKCWVAAAFPIVMGVIGAAMLHNSFLNDRLGFAGVFGASTECERRFDGTLAPIASPYLRQINLEKQDFKDTTLKRKNLSCGDLTDSTWHEADLRESLLWGADLRGAEFTSADISQAEFDGAILRKAKLNSVNAFKSEFLLADLSGALFTEADLQETRFEDAIMDEADFRNARLGHARLNAAELSGAKFQGAKITDTQFNGAIMLETRFDGAELTNVAFNTVRRKGNEDQIIEKIVDLESASFRNTELNEVTFKGANLTCTDFRGSTFVNVDFRTINADVLKTVRFDPEALAAAPPDAINVHILWPTGFEPRDAGSLRDTEDSPCDDTEEDQR